MPTLAPVASTSEITREATRQFTELTKALEAKGQSREAATRFLIGGAALMFADCLSARPPGFRLLLEGTTGAGLSDFEAGMRSLWHSAADNGLFGDFFHGDPTIIKIDGPEIHRLLAIADRDWTRADPALLGVLFTQGLAPDRREELGAEYTPPHFVNRLVNETVVEPIMSRWSKIRARVQTMSGESFARAPRPERALRMLHRFHAWLRSLRFLDPACGTGNLLYVALRRVRDIEDDVLSEIARLGGVAETPDAVTPGQFYGLERDEQAARLARLVLWVSFHQSWHQHPRRNGGLDADHCSPRIACRDSLICTSGSQPHPAEWPKADFVLGNPPFHGARRMKSELGEERVMAVRAAYPDLPRTIDYSVYWWHRAASLVIDGSSIASGMITPRTIAQISHRKVVERHIKHVKWVAPDQLWTGDGRAAVRIAMTVVRRGNDPAVTAELDEFGAVMRENKAQTLNPDFTVSDPATDRPNIPLRGNHGIAFQGPTLAHGDPCVLSAEVAEPHLKSDPSLASVVRPYLNAIDLKRYCPTHYVIDFDVNPSGEDAVRRAIDRYAVIRRGLERAGAACDFPDEWAPHTITRSAYKKATRDLDRFLVVPRTGEHVYCTFVPRSAIPTSRLVVIATDDAAMLGILSSTFHRVWAASVKAHRGVGNHPTYNHEECFNTFPIPELTDDLRKALASKAEQLDQWRRDVIRSQRDADMTRLYNVLRHSEGRRKKLTRTENRLRETLDLPKFQRLHRRLDQLVAEAYGWSWPLGEGEILPKLVECYKARLAEEEADNVHSLPLGVEGDGAVAT